MSFIRNLILNCILNPWGQNPWDSEWFTPFKSSANEIAARVRTNQSERSPRSDPPIASPVAVPRCFAGGLRAQDGWHYCHTHTGASTSNYQTLNLNENTKPRLQIHDERIVKRSRRKMAIFPHYKKRERMSIIRISWLNSKLYSVYSPPVYYSP